LGAFDFKEERVPGSNNKLVYIREKQEKAGLPAAAPQTALVPSVNTAAADGEKPAEQKPLLERHSWRKKKMEL